MRCTEEALMPRRATTGSAGYDVFAPERMVITTEWKTFDTGVAFEDGDMSDFQCALLLIRSSAGNKRGVHLRTGVSLIDSDYRDNILVTLATDEGEAVIEKGERICQLAIVSFGILPNEIVPKAIRNGGIGSTGA